MLDPESRPIRGGNPRLRGVASPHAATIRQCAAPPQTPSALFRRPSGDSGGPIHLTLPPCAYPRTGARDFHHPVVGDLTLTCEILDVSAAAYPDGYRFARRGCIYRNVGQ